MESRGTGNAQFIDLNPSNKNYGYPDGCVQFEIFIKLYIYDTYS